MSTLELIALLVILLIVALAPLLIKKVGDNLEPFLFCMGLLASLAASAITLPNIEEIFSNYLLYMITGAVLVVSFVFRMFEDKIGNGVNYLVDHMPLKVIVFLIVLILGFLSSIITAIVASLLLTEFVSLLPLERKNKVKISIIGCFSIGLGAVLTPVGEPLSTIVVSKLHGGFTYMISLLGIYVLVCVIGMAFLSTCFADNKWKEHMGEDEAAIYIPERETTKKIIIRAVKIFMFVVGLDLLGNGFKPLIDTYVIHWNNTFLYIANLLSAILDNATLAAAEISPSMAPLQIKAILMSLLISGGMLITGNIPNIITAGKLKISMKEWAKFAAPIGLALLLIFYVVLFVFKL